MKTAFSLAGWVIAAIAIWGIFQSNAVHEAAPVRACCHTFNESESGVEAEGTWSGPNLAGPINQAKVEYERGSSFLRVTGADIIGGVLNVFSSKYPITSVSSDRIIAEKSFEHLLTGSSGTVRIEINLKDKTVHQIKISDREGFSLLVSLQDVGFEVADREARKAWLWPLSLLR